MTRFLLLGAFHALFASFASAQPIYCAFEVKVSTPSGTPLYKIPVAIIVKHTSTFTEGTTDASGIARLCNAPLETVDIVVGLDICGSVLVSNLHATWPKVRRVYVTYVDAPCDHFGVTPSCTIMLRVQDREGRGIIGARLDEEREVSLGSSSSDVFGRIFQSLKKGQQLNGVVIKSGYVSAHISERCTDDLEVKVILQKQ